MDANLEKRKRSPQITQTEEVGGEREEGFLDAVGGGG